MSSTNGSDALRGTSPSAALATIAAALKETHILRNECALLGICPYGKPVRGYKCTVYIRGSHHLNQTLQLWLVDGDTTLAAWPGSVEPPLISGGALVPASAWRRYGHPVCFTLKSFVHDPAYFL